MFKNEKYKKLRWTPAGIFITIHHLAALIGLPFYFYYSPPGWSIIIATFVLLFLTELGIGAGYHRFYAHCAYKLNKIVEGFFAFFATMATQGQILKWSHDHRLHHKYVDGDRDPYNVEKGFWYAHVLWIFEDQEPIQEKNVPDLFANKLVMFQYRYYVLLTILSNTLVSLFVGWLTGDYIGAFIMCWGVRLLLSYHLTWFINSLAHYWGEQSYSKELSARDNAILAFLTVGEGYHNYHHTFPADYRNGVRFFHFDPVKWTIWTLSKLGLAKDLRQYQHENVVARLLHLDTRLLKQRLTLIAENPGALRAVLMRRAVDSQLALETHIEHLADRLKNRKAEIINLVRMYRHKGREEKRLLKNRIKTARQKYAEDWKSWSQLCSIILRVKVTD